MQNTKISSNIIMAVCFFTFMTSLYVKVVHAQPLTLPVVNLTQVQTESLAIKTKPLERVKGYPSGEYIAQSIVPLNQRYSVTMPVDGQVTELLRVHGYVNKGDVIAKIHSSKLLQLQSELTDVLADLKTEKAALKRAKSLSQTGAVSNKKRQLLEATVMKLTQSKIQKMQALLYIGMPADSVKKLEKSQQIQSADIELKAPVSGTLFNIKVELGQRLMAQSTVIYIAKTDPIVVNVDVPVKEITSLSDGQAVTLNGENKAGVVAHIADVVNPLTQSVAVHSKFKNADFSIKPGQIFSLQFWFDRPVYVTKLGALTNLNNQQVIFIKEANQVKAIGIDVLQTLYGKLYFTPMDEASISKQTQVVVHGVSSLKNSMMALESKD